MASVALQAAAVLVPVGGTLQLTVILRDAAGHKLTNRPTTFTSSNESVVSVDATGLARALAPGDATITATSEDKSGQMTISVCPTGDPCKSPWDY